MSGIRRVLGRVGPIGLLRRAGQIARDRAYLREAHVWYCLDLPGDQPKRELPDDVELRRAGSDELDRVEEIGRDAPSAHERAAGGNDLWFALRDDDHMLFACWIFHDNVPVLAAPGGRLDLPGDMVCLEDSVTSSAARGRGIAPASWGAIADSLAADGVRRMITKVGVENAPSRKAVSKAGFAEVGLMKMTRVAGWKRTTLEPQGTTGYELRDRISPVG